MFLKKAVFCEKTVKNCFVTHFTVFYGKEGSIGAYLYVPPEVKLESSKELPFFKYYHALEWNLTVEKFCLNQFSK